MTCWGSTTPGVPFSLRSAIPPLFGISAAPHLASRLTLAVSEMGTLRFLPRTTIALRFLLPMTAPMPVRPFARLPMLMMAATRTSFSPAGPTWATSIFLSPSSAFRRSSTSAVVRPHR